MRLRASFQSFADAEPSGCVLLTAFVPIRAVPATEEMFQPTSLLLPCRCALRNRKNVAKRINRAAVAPASTGKNRRRPKKDSRFSGTMSVNREPDYRDEIPSATIRASGFRDWPGRNDPTGSRPGRLRALGSDCGSCRPRLCSPLITRIFLRAAASGWRGGAASRDANLREPSLASIQCARRFPGPSCLPPDEESTARGRTPADS